MFKKPYPRFACKNPIARFSGENFVFNFFIFLPPGGSGPGAQRSQKLNFISWTIGTSWKSFAFWQSQFFA